MSTTEQHIVEPPELHPPARRMLTVRPWFDPYLAQHGVDPRSDYVERYWLGVVGPSVVMFVRRMARGLDEHADGFAIAWSDTARAIGLGGGTGRNSPMARTIDRACMFGLARHAGEDRLDVRVHLPTVTPRQLRRLPLAVRAAHDRSAHGASRSIPAPPDAA